MVASVTEVELRNALRVDDDEIARGGIDENIFLQNRGPASRIDLEYEDQERKFSSFYLPTAFKQRNIWGDFSPTISILCWIEGNSYSYKRCTVLIQRRSLPL